jgi:hypothetical protein
MRYYDLNIGGGPHYSSLLQTGSLGYPADSNDPNALRVAFTIENDSQVLSGNASHITVYGVDLQTLAAASNYTNKTVTLLGAFSKGLPLANLQVPHQGLLYQGTVWACFGNWRGSDVTLDLMLFPSALGSQGGTGGPGATVGQVSSAANVGTGGPSPSPQSRLNRRSLPTAFSPSKRPIIKPLDGGFDFGGLASSFLGDLSQLAQTAFGAGGFLQVPANLIHNLQPGQSLASAIQQTLSTAYPNANIINLISNYTASYQDGGAYQNMQQYNGYIKQFATALGSKFGIDIFAHGNNLIVTDWTQSSGDINLEYTDLIGQPTWISVNEIQFTTVMRPDLIPTYTVSFPQTLFGIGPSYDSANALTTPGLGQNSLQLTFNGTAQLHKIRHVGDSRSPDGSMWRTDCWAWYTGGNMGNTVGAVSAAGGIGRQ